MTMDQRKERHIWHLQYAWPNTVRLCPVYDFRLRFTQTNTEDRKRRGPVCRTMAPVSPLACWLTFDILVCLPCLQQLPQTITHCDGSLLLHNEMRLKCLIDFSFSFHTRGGNIVSCVELLWLEDPNEKVCMRYCAERNLIYILNYKYCMSLPGIWWKFFVRDKGNLLSYWSLNEVCNK